MIESDFWLRDAEGIDIFVRHFQPDRQKPRAVIQIEHGVVEHSGRYLEMAKRFCDSGYACYVDDHRGHGKTAESTGGLGRLGPGGWDAIVRDLAFITDHIETDHPGLPIFLLGFSWGSHLAQDYIQRWGDRLAGVVLVGSTGHQPFIISGLGPFLSSVMVMLMGPDAPSHLTDKLVFDAYNKAYLPSPTNSRCDWINRDTAEVRSFVEDPACGFTLSTKASLEMARAYRRLWKPDQESRIPRDLPVLIMSGSDDASNNRLADLKPLAARYRTRWNLADVTEKYYEGARHEIFHELNRDEVFADCIGWLDRHLGA